MYNIILYIGVGLIVGGFLLFLYSEMRLRQLEIEEVENQKFIDAILKVRPKDKATRKELADLIKKNRLAWLEVQ